MYCRTCSFNLSSQAVVCPKCGVPPKKGKSYCYNCSAVTHQDAVFCVSCQHDLSVDDPKKNPVSLIKLWSNYSYFNYVVIFFFSFMPFFNIKSNIRNTEAITGLNLAIGAERKYGEIKEFTNFYGYDDIEIVEKSQNLFAVDFCLFYIFIIVSMLSLSSKSQNKYKIAIWCTSAALFILIRRLIISGITINSEVSDVAFAYGIWCTFILTVVTLIKLKIYLKYDEVISIQNLPTRVVAGNSHSKNLQESQNEAVDESMPIVNPSVEPVMEDTEAVASFKTLKNKYDKLILYVVIFFLALVVLFAIYISLSKVPSQSSENDNPKNEVIEENNYKSKSDKKVSQTDTLPIINEQNKNSKTENSVSIDSQQGEVIEASFYIVNGSETNKVYFYNAPDYSTRRKGNFSTVETVFVKEIRNGFGYVEFTNSNGQTTLGWLEMIYLTKKE